MGAPKIHPTKMEVFVHYSKPSFKPKPLSERSVMVYGYVLQKNYREAKKEIDEILKKYRK